MFWRRLLLTGIIGLNIFLIYTFLWSDRGFFSCIQTKNSLKQLERALQDAEGTTLALSQEIRRLKDDVPYIEKMIRSKMNYIKPNEVLYVFSPDQPGNYIVAEQMEAAPVGDKNTRAAAGNSLPGKPTENKVVGKPQGVKENVRKN